MATRTSADVAPERRNKKVVQGEVTRELLVDVAVRLFSERGFASTSTSDIVEAAQVTRGALYHHFDRKEDLFEAAFEQVERSIADRIVVAAAKGTDPLDQLRLGTTAYLKSCNEPAVQRLVLTEGPSVLGSERWHELEQQYSFGLVVAAVRAGISAGLIRDQPVEPLAHLLFGAVVQAGHVIARSSTPRKTRDAMIAAIDGLLEDLRA